MVRTTAHTFAILLLASAFGCAGSGELADRKASLTPAALDSIAARIDVAAGTQVRAHVQGGRVYAGSFLAITSDTLRLEEKRHDVPLREVLQLQTHTDERTVSGWRALLGGFMGLGIGAALGTVAATIVDPCDDPGPDDWFCEDAAYYVGSGALLGALIGSGIGLWPRDRWVTIYSRPGIRSPWSAPPATQH